MYNIWIEYPSGVKSDWEIRDIDKAQLRRTIDALLKEGVSFRQIKLEEVEGLGQ